MEMVNGYVFLDLTKSNVYSKALKVLGTDKPVVIKDGSGSPYFVDSLTLDGTNVIITKGGKTITIANDNTITNVGDVLTIMENIVDIKGNKRFVEGEGVLYEITGVTFSYNKYSLSGTHLMFVIAGDVENGTSITDLTPIVDYKLPKYIIDKIVPVASTRVDTKGVTFYSSTLATQTMNNVRLNKIDDETIRIYSGGLNLDTDKSFRIQFDLLIDVE